MTSYLQMLTKPPKIAKLTLFVGLCTPSLVFQCGDIEKITGPTYSSLIFCHWNLNGLTAQYSIKILLLQDDICTLDNCLVTEIRLRVNNVF